MAKRVRNKSPSRKVTLRLGYEVELLDENGLCHLFQAILGETIRAIEELEVEPGGWEQVYNESMMELHFVAGQLHAMGSSMDLDLLMREFGPWWDDLGDASRQREGRGP